MRNDPRLRGWTTVFCKPHGAPQNKDALLSCAGDLRPRTCSGRHRKNQFMSGSLFMPIRGFPLRRESVRVARQQGSSSMGRNPAIASSLCNMETPGLPSTSPKTAPEIHSDARLCKRSFEHRVLAQVFARPARHAGHSSRAALQLSRAGVNSVVATYHDKRHLFLVACS